MKIETREIEINPRVIQHLGKDLITSSDVAVTELVKNSIDAKSTKVSMHLYDSLENAIGAKNILNPIMNIICEFIPIQFKNSNVFVIEDLGIGMNEQQLKDGFLTIGTDIKKKDDSITLGEKGIGRLAAQRLGKALVVETVSSENTKEVIFTFIDWQKIVQGNKEVKFSRQTINTDHSYTRLWIFDVELADFIEMPNQLQFLESSAYECNKELASTLNFLITPFETNERNFSIMLDYNDHTIKFDFSKELLNLSESTHYFNLSESGQLDFGLRITPWYIERMHLAAVKTEAFRRLRKPHFYYEELLNKNLDRIKVVLEKSLNRTQLYELFSDFYSEIFPSPKKDLTTAYEKEWRRMAEKSLEHLMQIVPLQGKIYSYKQNSQVGKDIIIDSVIEMMKRHDMWEQKDEAIYTLSNVKTFLNNYNGVKLYRGIHRIGFLGNKENDWIKLQQFRTKGQQWYRFDLGNTIGYVSLNDSHQEKIREISSRLDIQDNEYANAFKTFINIVFNSLFYELNRKANSVIKTILEENGLLLEDIHKRVKNNQNNMTKILSQNKQMLELAKQIGEELSSEVTYEGDKIIIPQKRFNLIETLVEDMNQRAEANVEAYDETAQLFAEANEQLKIIEVDSYNNFKLMANGLITETITHELHSVSKTNVDTRIPGHFESLKDYLKLNDAVPVYNDHVVPIKKGYNAVLGKIKSVSDMYTFLETTFIRKGTYDEFVQQNIGEVAENVFETLLKTIKLKNVDLLCDTQDLSWCVPKGVLLHVFYNMFNNSLYWINKRREYALSDRKYSRENRDCIAVEMCGTNELIISDTGVGVVSDMQDILFAPLQSGKPNKEGRGMGLYIVQELMKSFGGKIVLLNDINEYGNRYKFSLTIGGDE